MPLKLSERALRIKHRRRLLCICQHPGAAHKMEACALCDCKDFRRAAFQLTELPSWRRIPGPLSYLEK
jgi:hypothetical protein